MMFYKIGRKTVLSIIAISFAALMALAILLPVQKASVLPMSAEEAELAAVEKYNKLFEEMIKNRPVRDVPKDADFGDYLAATQAKNTRDFKSAARYFERAYAKDPTSMELLENTFVSYTLAGNVDKSLPYAQKVQEKNKKDLLSKLVVMASFVKKNDFKPALPLTQFDTDDGYSKLIQPMLEAWVYAGLKDQEKSLSVLNPLSKERGMDVFYWLNKALILDVFKDVKSAGEAYDKLQASESGKSLKNLLLARDFYLRTNQADDKLEFVQKYIMVQEESFVSKELLARPNARFHIDTPQKGMASALFDAAGIVGQHGSLETSLFLAQLSAYLDPASPVIIFFVGEVLEGLDRVDEANALYDTVKPGQALYLSVQLRKAQNNLKRERYADVVAGMQKVLNEHPDIPLFLMTQGDAYRGLGQYSKALKVYQKALDVLPNHQDPSLAVLYFYQAFCYEALDQPKKSEASLQQALTLDPDNPLYLNYMGYMWLEMRKNIPEALKMIETAVAQVPDDGLVLDSLGWAYYLSGNYGKALDLLEQAVDQDAGNAVINDHLGDVYWRLGRLREANFQWSHALILKQSSTEKLRTKIKEKLEKGLPNL